MLLLDGARGGEKPPSCSGSRATCPQAARPGGRGHDRIVRAIDLPATADIDLRGGKAWPAELVMEVLVARLAQLAR